MTRSQRLFPWQLTVALPLLFGSWPLLAQDEDSFDRTPRDCLPLANVDRTEVLDDQTILFYMRDKRAYRNYLPRKCPGLERQNRFMYETRSGRLCSIDTVTVLEQWGSRLESGFTCRLGEFHPLSPDEIEDLKNLDDLDRGRGNRASAKAIEAQPVELPAAADPEARGDVAAPPAAAED